MTTKGRGEREGTFGQRCLIAAAADARACWEEYIALVYAAAEGQPHDAGGNRRAELREEMHRAYCADYSRDGPACRRRRDRRGEG
jgi:hypothetical protein